VFPNVEMTFEGEIPPQVGLYEVAGIATSEDGQWLWENGTMSGAGITWASWRLDS
jgi:hypothetical protein